jgi:thioesterase domain-containing protein
MLMFADADSIHTEHIMEFYGLLGGGKKDAGWDGSGRPRTQLAVLPGCTHYNIMSSPAIATIMKAFLDATASKSLTSNSVP